MDIKELSRWVDLMPGTRAIWITADLYGLRAEARVHTVGLAVGGTHKSIESALVSLQAVMAGQGEIGNREIERRKRAEARVLDLLHAAQTAVTYAEAQGENLAAAEIQELIDDINIGRKPKSAITLSGQILCDESEKTKEPAQ